MIFDRRKKVEKFEEEFETENLKDRPVFYDLDISDVEDTEELRSFLLDSSKGFGYSISLNELTKFESEEFEGIFKGGAMKPIKGVLRAKKETKKGVEHPLLTILAFIASLAFLTLSFKPDIFNLGLEGKGTLFLVSSAILALISIGFYFIRKKILLRLWIKLVGIHDIEEGKADVRIVLAGDSKRDEGIDKIGKELSSIYQDITDSYLGEKLPEPEEEGPIIKEREEEGARERVVEKLSEAVDSLDQLDTRLAKGEISEEKYDELRGRLQRRKEKYETLLDVVK